MNTQQNQTKKGNKRVLNIIVNVILVIVVLFGALCSYTAFTAKRGDGVPDIFGLRIFSIQSPSMEPEFYKGDLIIDTRVKDAAELKVGDVITFYTIIRGERVLNTHRITAIEDNGTYLYFTTRGDNNTMEDSMGVHQNEIVGKYRFAIPKLGGLIDFLQTGTGFLLVIVLPVFLFFIFNFVQFFRAFFEYRMHKMRLQLQSEMQNAAAAAATPPAPPAPEAPAAPAAAPAEPETAENSTSDTGAEDL